MIEYKAEGSIEIERDEERGTSSTCPKCNHRYHPSGRTFLCPNCGWSGHRDLVGSGNQLGRHEPHADVAALIEQAHPKYLRPWQRGDRFSMGRFFRILRDGQKSVIIVMVTIRKYRHRLELCYG